MYINQKQNKMRLSRRAIFFIISILIVLTVLITGFVLLLTKGKEVEDTITPLPYTTANDYFIVGNNIVYSDQDLLTCIDTSMNIVWKVRLFTSGLNFESRDGTIAIIGGNFVQAIDENGKYLCSTQTTDGIVNDVRVCKDKFAVRISQLTTDEIVPTYIVIFDLNANSLYKIDVTDQSILDYGFDSKSELLYILELDVSGSAPVSRISTYRPETQSMTGIKELKNQLISKIFIQDETVYAIGTNQLIVYPSFNADEKEAMIYGWVLEDAYLYEDAKFVFVPSQNASGNFDTVRIINANGSEFTINLPPDVFSVLHADEKIYCFASNNIFVYTSEGVYLRRHTLPFKIDNVQKAMGNFVFVTVEDTVYLLPLP